MKFESRNHILRVSGLHELNASNANAFRDQTRAALQAEHHQLDIDFSEVRFLDSSGLGAMIALHKTMAARQGHVRVVSPLAQVQQVLELTRMHRIFELAQENRP